MTIIETAAYQENPVPEMIWEVKNKALSDLDRYRSELNFAVSILEDQLSEKTASPSEITGKEIRDYAGFIKEKTESLTLTESFDIVLARDIIRNCEGAVSFSDFFFNPKNFASRNDGKNFSVATYLTQFYGIILGQTPYAILERIAGNQRVKRDIHQYFKKAHHIKKSSKDMSLDGMLEKAQVEVLPVLERFCMDQGLYFLVPPEEIRQIEITLDKTNSEINYYDADNRVSVLDPNEIHYYEKDGEKKLFNGSILQNGMHEGGHAFDHVISRTSFPEVPGLWPSESRYNNLHLGLFEGIARMLERILVPQMVKKNPERYKVSSEETELMMYDSKYHLVKRTYKTIYSVLKARGNMESQPGFNVLKELERITGVMWRRDPNLLPELSLTIECPYQIGTLIGADYVKRKLKKLNQKYGRETIDKHMPLVLRGFFGYWQLSCHSDFYDLYIERAEKFFK